MEASDETSKLHGDSKNISSTPNTESKDLLPAIRDLLRKAYSHDCLSLGLREAVHKIESGSAQLCFLAKSCNEPRYVELIEHLCQEHSVNIIRVEKSSDLAQWCGLCKIDAEGTSNKTVNCSCAVITDFGEYSADLSKIKTLV